MDEDKKYGLKVFAFYTTLLAAAAIPLFTSSPLESNIAETFKENKNTISMNTSPERKIGGFTEEQKKFFDMMYVNNNRSTKTDSTNYFTSLN